MPISDSLFYNTVHKIDSIQAHVSDIRSELVDSTVCVVEALDISRSEFDEVSFWIALIAAILGGFTLLFTVLTYRSQRKTEKNTDKISIGVQKAQLLDMIRHLYRNLICTIAMSEEYQERLDSSPRFCYPSEEHLLKLKFLPDDVLNTDSFVNNDNVVKAMHKLNLLVRNYDIEVDVTLQHIKDPKIDRNIIKRDFDTLTLKCLMFINEILKIEEEINKTSRAYRHETHIDLVQKALGLFLQSHLDTVRSKINDKRIQWDKYEFKNYASASDFSTYRQANILLSGLDNIDRSVLLKHINLNDENGLYMNGDIRYSKLNSQTKGHSLHSLFENQSIDTRQLLSLIISIDSSLEKSIVSIITPRL